MTARYFQGKGDERTTDVTKRQDYIVLVSLRRMKDVRYSPTGVYALGELEEGRRAEGKSSSNNGFFISRSPLCDP